METKNIEVLLIELIEAVTSLNASNHEVVTKLVEISWDLKTIKSRIK